MNKFLQALVDAFQYQPVQQYRFSLSNNDTQTNNNEITPIENLDQVVFPSIDVNLEYVKVKFNGLINSDIKIRQFDLKARNRVYKAFLLYIDGMANSKSINHFILHPLMLRNKANSFDKDEEVVSTAVANNVSVRKRKKFNLVDYIFSCLIPLNDTRKSQNFKEIINAVNTGECALFVDTIDTCFLSDVKGFEKRSIETPQNETVIRGSQESFVEIMRTNTSMLRRLVNNENLVIENATVGAISKTQCSICYMQDVANNDLVAEVKYRINNLDVDYILSSGELEDLMKENPRTTLAEVISTERPDIASAALFDGRVIVLVNGSPIALIMPCTFFDLLSS